MITWDDGPYAALGTEDIARGYAEALENPGAVAESRGDVDGAMAAAVTKVSAQYQVPFCPCRAGADELHGACAQGCLRDMGRQPGAGAGASNRG